MKKILAMLMAALMLASCAGNTPSETPGNDNNDAPEAPKRETNIMESMEPIEDCPVNIYINRTAVTYGEVTHFTYHSDTTKCDRGANILLPANYDKSKKYPVLYFLHGIFGDENSMINSGATEITANLVADGLAEEMIVVYPNMYASDDPNLQPGFTDEQVAPYDNFINDLVNDLMPYIEKNYSVLTGRDNTAILGFSMGGRESLFIGLSRPDLFGYVGAISPAPGLSPGQDWAMKHPGQLSEDELTFEGKDYSPYLLMVCCGTKDGTVGSFPKSYHEIFDRNGVKHIWYEIDGADHDDRAIKSGINNFVRNIFVRAE